MILTSLSILSVLLALWLLRPQLEARFQPALVEYLALHMDEETRDRLYAEVSSLDGGLYEPAPDPRVARLGKRNVTRWIRGAEVVTNNAGFRSDKPFITKPPEVFRIICLGDSFVLGHGGLVEDRFCDQLEEFYGRENVRGDGRVIETYAVGLPSWTLIQEATYLSTRLSAYDPDVILHLGVSNDITDNLGVSGTGLITREFSPQHRVWGSAVFSNQVGIPFGVRGYTALATDLGPEARQRWREAMAALDHLVRSQEQRGRKILLSVLNPEGGERGLFEQLYLSQASEQGIEAPLMVISYLASEATRLSHDGHPNRRGHEILRDQYIHALDRLGWVDVPDSDLPDLDRRLAIQLQAKPDLERTAVLRQNFIDNHLRPRLDFRNLTPSEVRGLLGGIFPEERGPEALQEPPWASVRAGFLLQVTDPRARELRLLLSAPPIPELFPLTLEVTLSGQPSGIFRFPGPQDEGEYEILAPLPEAAREQGFVEVLLTTSSYFSGTENPAMRSYRLLEAEVR